MRLANTLMMALSFSLSETQIFHPAVTTESLRGCILTRDRRDFASPTEYATGLQQQCLFRLPMDRE